MADHKKTIGALVGGVNTFFPKEIIRGIEAAAEQRGINVLFFLGVQTTDFYKSLLAKSTAKSYDYQFNTIYDYSILGDLDGRIINYGTIGTYFRDNNAEDFAKRYDDLPEVFLTDEVDASKYSSVISDNFKGMYSMVSHLIEDCGAKKVLHLAGPVGNRDALERREGYLAAMRDHNLEVTDDMIETGDFSEFVNHLAERLIDNNPDVDAIAVANDEMSIACYAALKRRGYQIGKDVFVTGYDNNTMAAEMDPPLTTLLQDGIAMGRRSVDVMEALWRGEKTCVERVPTKIILRESTGYNSLPDGSADDIVEKLADANKRIADIKLEMLSQQRLSWFIPYFARELDEYAGNDRDFCNKIVEGLKQCNTKSAYLYVLDTPITCNSDEQWELPDDLRLAAWVENDEHFAYELFDRPLITKQQGMASYIKSSDGRAYMVFLLFSGPTQYGLLACDASVDEIAFYYMMSLQLGISFRYHESRKVELAYQNKLLRDMAEIKEKNRELDIASLYDSLTGVLNRRGLFEKTKRMISKYKGKTYLIFVDLDHLKQINDGFGHSAGDYAIKQCAGMLRTCLRDSDIIARIGGDEFVCVIPAEGPEFASEFEKRLHKLSDELNMVSGKPFYIECSFGIISEQLNDIKDLENAMGRADEHLYESKKHRRMSAIKDNQ